MKKTTTAKKTAVKKTAARKVQTAPAKQTSRASAAKPCFNPWSMSIYVYWFIILFFIAATFYILGRSHNMNNVPTQPTNVEITEEALMQTSDYENSGKTKLLSGDVSGAVADLTTVIDDGNAASDIYVMRGEAYLQSGDYRAALSDFDAAIEKDVNNAVAHYDRALLNSRLEDYSAALNDINNALAALVAQPTDVLQMRDLYAKRGQLNLWLKNWNGAVADYTNSLSRPEGVVSPSVYAERAEAYTALGQYQDAINDYTSAVRVISEQIQGAVTAEMREELSSRAMSYFEKSAALNLQLGNITGARSDLESAYTIAVALNDGISADRLQALAMDVANQE